jgi:prepilin-type N-terminal cleavage/methylation domain-containing protein
MRRVLHPTRSTPRTALRAGFTLIELCMATVMLGVLAGTAAPRVAAQLARARVAQAAAVTAPIWSAPSPSRSGPAGRWP